LRGSLKGEGVVGERRGCDGAVDGRGRCAGRRTWTLSGESGLLLLLLSCSKGDKHGLEGEEDGVVVLRE
jgi:hypothetical protein